MANGKIETKRKRGPKLKRTTEGHFLVPWKSFRRENPWGKQMWRRELERWAPGDVIISMKLGGEKSGGKAGGSGGGS